MQYCKIRRSNEKPSYTLHDIICGAIGLAIGCVAITIFIALILWLFVEAMRP